MTNLDKLRRQLDWAYSLHKLVIVKCYHKGKMVSGFGSRCREMICWHVIEQTSKYPKCHKEYITYYNLKPKSFFRKNLERKIKIINMVLKRYSRANLIVNLKPGNRVEFVIFDDSESEGMLVPSLAIGLVRWVLSFRRKEVLFAEKYMNDIEKLCYFLACYSPSTFPLTYPNGIGFLEYVRNKKNLFIEDIVAKGKFNAYSCAGVLTYASKNKRWRYINSKIVDQLSKDLTLMRASAF